MWPGGIGFLSPTALKQEYFKESPQLTTCPWKGVANYYTITANGAENPDAAWTYLDPSPRAAHIKDYVAFWRGVTVSN